MRFLTALSGERRQGSIEIFQRGKQPGRPSDLLRPLSIAVSVNGKVSAWLAWFPNGWHTLGCGGCLGQEQHRAGVFQGVKIETRRRTTDT